MLGTLRLFLALAVLFSHIPGIVWPRYPGVIAVVCFYIISGHLMYRSFCRFDELSPRPIRDFYIDRVIKLFPQYLLVVLATAALLDLLGPSESYWLLQQEPSIAKLLLNAMLLPANYVFEPFVIPQLLPHPLVAPGWSLATEFHFYLLLPLLFLNRKLLLVLLIATLCIQYASFIINSPRFSADSFGYRYIVGVLPVFMLGYLHAHAQRTAQWSPFIVLWAVYVAGAAVGWNSPDLTPGRMDDIVLGASLAPILLSIAAASVQKKTRSTWDRIDRALGNLAYPVFITHCLAFYLVEQATGLRVAATPQFMLLAVPTCFALSMPLHLLQIPIERIRIRHRGFTSMRQRSTSPEQSRSFDAPQVSSKPLPIHPD